MDAILTVNVGSSSVKCAVYHVQNLTQQYLYLSLDHRETKLVYSLKNSDKVEVISQSFAWESIEHAVGLIEVLLHQCDARLRIVAVGHRVVHGGANYSEPTRIDAVMLEDLRALIPLAPLHLPPELVGIEALMQAYVDAVHVACFDTAFHASQDALVRMYGLPRKFYDAGVKRYGFHGLSYAYIAEAMPQLIKAEHAQGRVIVLHLGNGASACAMLRCKSVASSMGFTALDGLVMGTRCGSLDVGAMLYIMRRWGLSIDETEQILYQESGLKGVSGMSADMRTLQASPEAHARQAVDMFVYRVVREIGSLVAALGGVDALVFTAGIGEHSAIIRADITAQLGWLGVEMDTSKNAIHALCCSTVASKVGVYVIPTNEEQMIAHHIAALCPSFF